MSDHGTNQKYQAGCICTACRAAHTAERRRTRLANKAKLEADPTLAPHGAYGTYTNWMCRCVPCSEASKAAKAATQTRAKRVSPDAPEQVRKPHGVAVRSGDRLDLLGTADSRRAYRLHMHAIEEPQPELEPRRCERCSIQLADSAAGNRPWCVWCHLLELRTVKRRLREEESA